jgi:asparagine synthase (glutamine-hydrolysing)
MCGISGVFHHEGGLADPGALARMAAAMVHRGPDDEGFFTDGPLGLAFRRLAIIDVAGGHQPILSPDGKRVIVFNGEIYNHAELRREFEARGRVFRTRTDTEVILAAYEAHGPEGVEKLRGMFAYAIYDRDAHRLVLARDRLGVKPLYWSDHGGRLLFGSEIKCLLAHGGLGRDLDIEAVADYASLRYVPAPKTIFRDVRKLEPGHILVAERGRPIRVARYWDLRFEPEEDRSEAELVEELRGLLDEAVGIRLMSEVPLGAFLSGGVDSAAVVATMARVSTGRVSTHTIGFDEAGFDESAEARALAQVLGTDHHEERVRPDALGILDTLAWHFDEPLADASSVPTFHVCRMARRHVTVALSGDGGDEAFAGYVRRYRFERAEDRVRGLLPRALRRPLFSALASVYPASARLPRPLRARTTLRNLALDPPVAFFHSMALAGSGPGPAPWLAPALRESLRDYRPADLFGRLMAAAGTEDPVSRAQYVDIKSFLADDVLAKVDRMSMAVSLEAREPLLDHRLLEWAARVPSRLKLRGRTGKYILRRALEDRVPPGHLDLRKRGFELPVGAWFRGPLLPRLREVLADPGPAAGVFDGARVQTLLDDHLAGRRDSAHHLWMVLMFHLWARRHARA